MNDKTIHPLTQNVLDTFADCTDPRLKQIMTALVTHLHAFASEVELTGDEWRRGIEFLTATGKMCNGIRQEFILLSDTLGLSIMIDAINQGLSLVLISLLFAAIYKLLPNTPLLWRDVAVGAIGTALLFEAGQALIGIYLARFISANIYGAAAGVIVLLVWVYYSAQIFLLGAEFTKVWAHHYGSQQNDRQDNNG